ncbi:hypothetical protein A3B85_00460 [Candidatus Nomurabacteria bacterium RIFCSPHIGHO2_02_FULL_37_13]|uniref:LTD domain-containing protein n=1 Tax=Candidatus Nomurabacteria bacterium RIFCSPHIGHO2_02_FULL_37_13 TaxID=1801750 RepID=A0A1F6W486_9BACT|nr:MAG: hypothetical protein A2640_02480 [Candidatus Nomurabacteria bacterium RIFCSPHIGHO2_01_FULL_36_23]OGI76723.1 MAG: hypothetical protein A3B85_00460 [Candidatus Nomurabacteria bacterium RIFCSPHIGHO2_02_FULL_37_13]OGI86976.1 MAG: hypothetical protein A2906_00645 [Candidatus Nomurabacteria bacterium RIFCSPLOWO2_01_FULL_37_25]
MSQKIILFLSFFLFLFSYHFAFANVEINEIMYDLKTGSDDGREWVEVFNNSDAPADLSILKFFEAETNHKLKWIQGDANIPAKGYALIVSDPIKFKIDWPNFSGIIFDSSFSLSNDGEILAIKNEDLLVDQYDYKSSSGGGGDGKSLQKINGSWREAIPTPGKENKISYIPLSLPETKPTLKKASDKIVRQDLTTITTIPSEEIAMAPENSSYSYLFIITLILLLSVGVRAVYFIRRRGVISKKGNDFEILDE